MSDALSAIRGERLRRTTVAAAVLVVIASMTLLASLGAWSSATPAQTTRFQPALIPGDYILYTCTNSKITAGSTTLCNNQQVLLDSCDSTVCLLSVTDTPASGYTFSKWTSSGDAFLSGSSSACGSSTSSTSNPATFCMSVPNVGSKYSGDLTVTVT